MRNSVLLTALGGVVTALLISSCSDVTHDAPLTVPGCPSGTVVRTVAELEEAVAEAGPGTDITLAPGRYRTHLELAGDGSPERPIELCGPATAVIDGGAVDTGYTVHLDGASWWTLTGFTVTGGQKGVMMDRTSHSTLRALTIHDVGDEGLHLRAASSDNLIDGVNIRATGLHDPEFGEGVYVGSAQSNWCEISSCAPDRSDRNRIVAATISRTSAEAIDLKEGTRGGEVTGGTLTGGSGPGTTADSVVDVKGNGWRITGNTITAPAGAGIAVLQLAPGEGVGNLVRPNRFVLGAGAEAVRR